MKSLCTCICARVRVTCNNVYLISSFTSSQTLQRRLKVGLYKLKYINLPEEVEGEVGRLPPSADCWEGNCLQYNAYCVLYSHIIHTVYYICTILTLIMDSLIA